MDTHTVMPVVLMLGVCVVLTGCSTAPRTTREDHRRLVTRIHEEIFSAHDVGLISRLYAEDFVGHFPEATVHGNEAVREHCAALFTGFPDWHEEVHRMAIDGDLVFTHFTSSGTNLGDWRGQPATGRRVEFEEAAWFRIRDGQVIEQRIFPDLLRMQQQLRGLPSD